MCRKTDWGMNSAEETLGVLCFSYPAEVDRVLVAAFFFLFFHLVASLVLGSVFCRGVLSAGQCAWYLLKVPACCTSDLPRTGACSSWYPWYLAHRHCRNEVDKGTVEAGTCFRYSHRSSDGNSSAMLTKYSSVKRQITLQTCAFCPGRQLLALTEGCWGTDSL